MGKDDNLSGWDWSGSGSSQNNMRRIRRTSAQDVSGYAHMPYTHNNQQNNPYSSYNNPYNNHSPQQQQYGLGGVYNAYPASPMFSGYPATPYGVTAPNSANTMVVEDGPEVWKWQFEQFSLPNMDLYEAQYVPQDPRWKMEMRKAFKRARRDFLKFVGYNHEEECRNVGIDDEGIKKLKKGRAPENFNVHQKLPLDYSGSNDFSNLCLIQTHPYHEDLHKFIDLQFMRYRMGQKPRLIYIPIPDVKVYNPNINASVSASGGKEADDPVYADFIKSAFPKANYKSNGSNR